MLKGIGNDFILTEEPVSERDTQSRDMRVAVDHVIPARAVVAHLGQVLLPCRECFGSGLWEKSSFHS